MPMAAGSKSMSDVLKSVLAQLAQAQALPDADINVLGQLQQAIVTVLRAGSAGDGVAQGGGPPGAPPGGAGPGMPGGGAPPGGPPGGMPPGAPAPGGPAAAGMGGPGGPMGGLAPSPTNMDEIRRMLTAARPG